MPSSEVMVFPAGGGILGEVVLSLVLVQGLMDIHLVVLVVFFPPLVPVILTVKFVNE